MHLHNSSVVPIILFLWKYGIAIWVVNDKIQVIPPAVYSGSSLEEKVLDNGSNESEQEQTKLKTSEVGHKASTVRQVHPSQASNDWDVVGGRESGTTAAEVHKASEQNRAVGECGEQMKHLMEFKSNKMLLER